MMMMMIIIIIIMSIVKGGSASYHLIHFQKREMWYMLSRHRSLAINGSQPLPSQSYSFRLLTLKGYEAELLKDACH